MDGDSVRAIVEAAESLLHLGKPGEALARLRPVDAAAAGEDLRDEVLALRAIALTELDRGAEAEALLRGELEQSSDSPTLVGALGMVLAGCGRAEEARELIEQALEGNPDDAGLLANLAFVLDQLGDLKAAIECYEESLEAGGESAWLLPRLASLHVECDDIEAAKECLRKHLDQTPSDAESWISLATLHCDDEEFDAAIDCYRRSEKLDADSVALRVNWGTTAVRAGRISDAQRQLDELRRLDPDSCRSLVLAALLDEARGRSRESTRAFDEALRVAAQGDSAEQLYALETAIDHASRNGLPRRCEELFAAAYRANLCTADVCDAHREACGKALRRGRWFSVNFEADYRAGLDAVGQDGGEPPADAGRFRRNIQVVARDRDEALSLVQRVLGGMGEANVRIVEFVADEPLDDDFAGVYAIEPQSVVLPREDRAGE